AQFVGVPTGRRTEDGDLHWLSRYPGAARSALEERSAQHVRVESTGVERPSAPRATEPHLGGAEEHRVYLIEVVVVAFENVVEDRAVIGGGGGGKALGECGELVVLGVHGVPGLTAVENAVVCAADCPD